MRMKDEQQDNAVRRGLFRLRRSRRGGAFPCRRLSAAQAPAAMQARRFAAPCRRKSMEAAIAMLQNPGFAAGRASPASGRVSGIRFTGCTARITLRVTSMPVRAVPIVFPSWNTSCVSGFPRVCRKSFLQALPAGSVSPLPLRGAPAGHFLRPPGTARAVSARKGRHLFSLPGSSGRECPERKDNFVEFFVYCTGGIGRAAEYSFMRRTRVMRKA